jgi:hypothetical protein
MRLKVEYANNMIVCMCMTYRSIQCNAELHRLDHAILLSEPNVQRSGCTAAITYSRNLDAFVVRLVEAWFIVRVFVVFLGRREG